MAYGIASLVLVKCKANDYHRYGMLARCSAGQRHHDAGMLVITGSHDYHGHHDGG